MSSRQHIGSNQRPDRTGPNNPDTLSMTNLHRDATIEYDETVTMLNTVDLDGDLAPGAGRQASF